MPPDIDFAPGALELIPFYMSLIFTGGALNLVLVLYSILSNDIRRIPAFTNFAAVLVFFSLGYGLLSLAGETMTRDPPIALCLIQAAAVYGNIIMLVVAYLILQFLFWRLMREDTQLNYLKKKSLLRLEVMLNFLPYLCYLTVFCPRLLEGAFNGEIISRAPHAFYCSLRDNNAFGTTLRATAAVLGLIGLFIEVLTVRFLRITSRSSIDVYAPKDDGRKYTSTLVRIVILTVYVVLCVLLSLMEIIASYVKTPLVFGSLQAKTVTDLLVASIPLMNGSLFITQKDYRHAISNSFRWLFIKVF